ncbi:motility associated factor glycosyltransferase family protein [Treponema sp.]|uniref:motility associated factor glycosyltransferase family protein n=1 Tax=Treponema sp. TaxID=166 RepID=UPI00298E243B|nr:6-hydroxymethylpterin diphosphokinase MptE-like protein [Treponema sp.]MCQ2240604.1 DUF115 domain-containing protein [Treponema sp.]
MIYSGTIEAKTGHIIPVYKSGKPAHSKYNPQADKIQLPENTSGCVLVFGIGAGFHIKNLLSNKNIAKVIGIEEDNESLEFCRTLNTVAEVQKDERVVLCSIENFNQCFGNNYIPVLHKKLTTVFLRSWHDEFSEADEKINMLLKESLESISADISVQAHFGKHWHRNILSNLQFISRESLANKPILIPEGKTRAAVIAAGPTLDTSIGELKKQKSFTFIVSTDTAYGTLLSHGIIPDAVVSVDAQQISSEHFLGIEKTETIFVFDLSSNPEIIHLVHEKGNKIFFIGSNHPLTALVKEELEIPLTESGSGTVTIAAADWARQQNFREIEFFGADFAYSNGKPYCRGTYLEKKFNSTSCRTSSSEKLYSSLMFRTELEKTEDGLLGKLGKSAVTSKVLASYGSTLLQWASKYGFIQEGRLFKATKEFCREVVKKHNIFDYKSFVEKYISKVQNLSNTMEKLSDADIAGEILKSRELISLLPLFAAFGKESIREDISLALQFLLYYNLSYENKK